MCKSKRELTVRIDTRAIEIEGLWTKKGHKKEVKRTCGKISLDVDPMEDNRLEAVLEANTRHPAMTLTLNGEFLFKTKLLPQDYIKFFCEGLESICCSIDQSGEIKTTINDRISKKTFANTDQQECTIEFLLN